MGADTDAVDPPSCQYRGYRNPPQDDKKYDLSPQYWHVFAARLAFVVVFEVMSQARSASNVHTIQIFTINSFSVSLTGLCIETLNANVVEFLNFKIKKFLKFLCNMQG
jgi:hypothetical protein